MNRDRPLNAALAVLVLVTLILSVLAGRTWIPLFDAVRLVIAGDGSGLAVVTQEIRLPRAILGALVGAALGLAGAAMQGLLRNPLTEPGLIGISGAAALGAVLAFYSGLAALIPLALPLGGITGALLAALAIHLFSRRDHSVLALILAGIAINSLAGALTALALNLAPSPYAALEVFFWLLGSLVDRSFDHVALAAPLMVVGWALFVGAGRGLDALSMGEDTAASLGVDLGRLRFRLILGTALSVGAAVAVTGIVGFVGLVVPHLLRPLVGHQPSRLLLPSALGGAALTLAADTLARLTPTGSEIKLGVLTAILGSPFFFLLLVRTRRAVT